MQKYLHDLPDWPDFHWNPERLAGPLAEVSHEQGRLMGHLEAQGFQVQQEAVLKTLTSDVLKTSEIEGERLDAEQVRSSIARRLGLDIGGLKPADRNVKGVVEMMLDATRNYDQPLTAERLLGWHASLFPSGRSGMSRIQVGRWRDDSTGPMQVISGAVGRENIHFEAPAAARLDKEMSVFIDWFNREGGKQHPILTASLAHLWFVTIHPFDDGNGRIARAIADMQLTRGEGSPHRFYSMSAQIRQERNAYYDILERTEKGTMDITPWMEWFLGCLGRAVESAQKILAGVLAKAKLWESLHGTAINERQRIMLNRLVDGFEGKLTTVKWSALAKCSHDSALRDIHDLVARGILKQNTGGGRSTSYSLAGAADLPE